MAGLGRPTLADHPVKAPAWLVEQWIDSNIEEHTERLLIHGVADRAAQWGADQELEAVEHWLITGPYGASIAASAPNLVADLRAARRPKPPTLAEQGMEALRGIKSGTNNCREQDQAIATLATVVNRLAELEAQADG